MKILVCGGRDFGNLPENLNPNRPLSDGSYSKINWDHPDIKKKNEERLFIYKTLDQLAFDRGLYSYYEGEPMMPENITIISGAAKGVDSVAIDWAITNWLSFKEFPANWDKYGKAAGPIRNKQMLEEGKPDLVVAFPGGRGTANMVKLAKEAGVEVIEIEYPI